MIFRLLADLTVVLHLAFVVFVVFGGLLVLRHRTVAWFHLPAAAWGAWIEFAGWICPLTPLENWLRARGGGTVYGSSFVERYLVPTLYPEALTRELQWLLGGVVIVVNLTIYLAVFGLRARRGWGGAGDLPSHSRDRAS
jgi:Protein of Unknown function (DUF2784)